MSWTWTTRAVALATAAGVGNCAYAAHYYRPVPEYPGESHQPTRRRLLDLSNEVPAVMRVVLCDEMT